MEQNFLCYGKMNICGQKSIILLVEKRSMTRYFYTICAILNQIFVLKVRNM